MIGFSITTWCIAVIMLCLGISLLKGNYTFVHGSRNCHFRSDCSCTSTGVCYAGRDNFFVTGGSSNDWSVL